MYYRDTAFRKGGEEMAKLAGLYKERAENEIIFILNKLAEFMQRGQEAHRELHEDEPLACAHWEDFGRDLETLAMFAQNLTAWLEANAVAEPLPSPRAPS